MFVITLVQFDISEPVLFRKPYGGCRYLVSTVVDLWCWRYEDLEAVPNSTSHALEHTSK